jgi:signal recognition particle subunit SRP54
LVLSKFDGDAKGGAALSIQTVTQCPIKFLGIGEQLPALEVFAPERLVSRMLGMGDIVGLVEKAQLEIDSKDAERLAQKIHQRTFNLQDFLDQLRMIKKLGPLQNLLGMIPGLGNLPSSAIDDNALKRTEAIIQSMTRQERANPDILNGRRRQRIASGSGTTVMEVNDLIHRFGSMKKIMGDLNRGGNKEKKMKDLLSRLKM